MELGAQMVVPWPRTDGKVWGIICPDHPTRAAAPTDSTLAGAEALAEACVCSHPAHVGVTLTSMDTPAYVGAVVRVGAYVRKYGRARLAFFGDHDDAGLVEIGFLDGTTTRVPFDWCRLAWPLPDEYRVIPAFPEAPDAHLTADQTGTPGGVLVCSVCSDRVADGDAGREGQSEGAPCVWVDCQGVYRDPGTVQAQQRKGCPCGCSHPDECTLAEY